MITKARDALHYPRAWWLLAGVVALIGAIGLLVGLFVPVVGAAAALWLDAYFIVATGAHLRRNDFVNVTMPFFFLVLAAGLTVLRWADVTALFAQLGH
jgi:hypothetical protein